MQKLNLFIWLILGVLLFTGIDSFAQGTVTGLVTDGETGEIVIGAYITNGTETVASDFYGSYTISLPTGVHDLSCSFIGMGKANKSIHVQDGIKVVWDISLQPEAKVLDIAVVSAGRFEQSVEEVTVSLEVLQPALVENKATTSLESAIEQTPGVSLVDGEPQIRSGSGFSYGAGSRVLVMVDDLPVLSGDAGRPTWGFLPLENLEQIEIIKGASSVLYGSAALSGVINIRTRFPDARPLTRITLQHGAYSGPTSKDAKYWDGALQQSNFRFLHSRRLGGWDIVVGGNFLGDDGYKGPEITNSGKYDINRQAIPPDTASSGFNPFSVDRFAANSRARINFNIRRRKSVVPGLTYGLSTNWQKGESLNTLIWQNNTEGLYSSYDGGATRTKQLVGTVDPFVEYLTRDGVRISFRNRWQHLNNDNNNGQDNNSDVFYSELQTQKLGALGIQNMAITTGIVHQYTISSAELYAGGNEEGENNARNIAGYIQLDKPIGERLNLSLGLRHEFFSINNEFIRDSMRFDMFNASVPVLGRPVFRSGFNFQAFEETYFRGSVGQGYRFPTIAEKYIRTGLGQLQIYPNLDLLPETSTSIELGVKQGLKLKEFMGYFDLAVFQQEYSNFIEFTWGRWNPESNDIDELYGFGFRSLNTGRSRVRGIEGSIMGRALWGTNNKYSFDLLTGYTYTNPVCLTPNFNYDPDNSNVSTTYLGTSIDTTGYVLKYRSRHIVRFDAQFTAPIGFIGISARYQSAHENYDAAFLELDGLLDDPSTPINESWGLNAWLEENTTLPWIWDARMGFSLNDLQKLSFVVSNLFNKEYAIRPLAIEAPRLFNLVYTYEIQ